jgi:hypothetical protein
MVFGTARRKRWVARRRRGEADISIIGRDMAEPAEIEQRVRSLTRRRFKAVPDCDPVLAIDIDTARDLEVIRPHARHLEGTP